MKKNREELLANLEAVAAGLATRETIEQSSCFIFEGGRVITFNDEIACCIECDLGFDGAVAATPLLELLRKLIEKDIDIAPNEEMTELIVKGKRRRSGVTMEAEIALPRGALETPGKWRKLDPEFLDAIGVVQRCASKDINNTHLMCIHITPDFVEACDNFHLARYPVATHIKQPCLVKNESIRHVTGVKVSEISVTNAWLHFRNPNTGLVFSVRLEEENFEDLNSILEIKGTLTTLPGGLAEAIDRAEIFSALNSDNNLVQVTLRKGELRLRGEGVSGWYEERKKVKWEKEPLSFKIDPKMLVDITTQANECVVAPGVLKVENGKYTYVTCLSEVTD